MLTKITHCNECGSADLSWHTFNRNNTSVVQGRLNTSDISCMFVLGCVHCSETLAVISADNVAASLNAEIQVEK